jgi:uncharacterized repeat protein (TIGR01451 family)
MRLLPFGGPVARARSRTICYLAAVVALVLATAGAAQAYQAAPGWTASDYVTGFPFRAGFAGPIGLAFDGDGNLFVTASDSIYKVPPGGGTESSTTLHAGYPGAAGLAFDKKGRLYMAQADKHTLLEINPSNGTQVRTVLSGLACPIGLATDPLSGDLFLSNVFCIGGGIMRITGFQTGTGKPTASVYAGAQDADGLAFGPDGTLYIAAKDQILRIAGTNSPTPGAVTPIASVPTADGIAFAPATATSGAFLMVARNDGEIDRVGVDDGSVTPIVTGATRGDLVTVGPDQCMYADLEDRVIKIGPASGSCAFAATGGGSSGGGGGGGGAPGGNAGRLTVDTAVVASAPQRIRRGRRFTLRISVRNMSQNVAHNASFTDILPRGTKFVRARAVKGVSCKRRGTRTVTCTKKSNLAPGKSFTVRLVVLAQRGSTYTNVVRVRSRDLDPTPGNNKATSVTQVLGR